MVTHQNVDIKMLDNHIEYHDEYHSEELHIL